MLIRLNRFEIASLTGALMILWLAIAHAQELPPDVIAAYAEVGAATEITIRLPQVIPLNSPAAPDPDSVWARVIEASPDEYNVSFDRAEDCTGVMECSFGGARGYKLTGQEPSIEDLYQNVYDPNGDKGYVDLESDRQVYFVPAEEGLYDPATATWDEEGARYELQLYMASKNDLVTMANSGFSSIND